MWGWPQRGSLESRSRVSLTLNSLTSFEEQWGEMAGFQAEEWHNEIFTLGRSLRIWSRGELSREGWTGTQFGSRQRADGGLDKRVAVGMEKGGCCQDYIRRWSEWGLVTDQTGGGESPAVGRRKAHR